MSAGKGSRPRPVDGERFRAEHDRIFRKVTDLEPPKGEVIDGHVYLGGGGWQTVDQHEAELRDEE